MKITHETYDPSETLLGSTITLGDILAMDCVSGMPAAIVESDDTRYATTVAEYDQYGAHVPVLKDVEIGCKEYQRVTKLGLPVLTQVCESCPLYSSSAE